MGAQGKISDYFLEGACDGSDKERELDKIIGWDFNWVHTTSGCNRLYPSFERKILEELPDGSQRVQTENGMIERIKPGIESIPSEDDYLLKDRKAFEELYLPKMQYTIDRIGKHFENFNEKRPWDVPVGLNWFSIMLKKLKR